MSMLNEFWILEMWKFGWFFQTSKINLSSIICYSVTIFALWNTSIGNIRSESDFIGRTRDILQFTFLICVALSVCVCARALYFDIFFLSSFQSFFQYRSILVHFDHGCTNWRSLVFFDIVCIVQYVNLESFVSI